MEEIVEHPVVTKDTVYALGSPKHMPGNGRGRCSKFNAAEGNGWVWAGGAARATTGLAPGEKE